MEIHYYLSCFPTEGLIASQLEPEEFGSYMAVGSKKGHKENIVFIELLGEFEGAFDWHYAHQKCVTQPNGRPKHSVYLSIYRVLEHIPLDLLGSLYLTTCDGRSLELSQSSPENLRDSDERYIYQELCPVRPVIVSVLEPQEFARYITDQSNKIWVPKIVFTDTKMIDFSDPERSGNIGGIYDDEIYHLKDCLDVLDLEQDKLNKTFDRSHVDSFTYQAINTGIYVADRKRLIFYPMKSLEELRDQHYYWAESAMII